MYAPTLSRPALAPARAHVFGASLAAFVLAACGGAQRSPAPPDGSARVAARPLAVLPTEAQTLEATSESPAALTQLLDPSVRPVDDWLLEATPVLADLPYTPEGPFEALLDRAARQRVVGVHRSGSLRCAAQEIGRYLVRHRSSPPPRFVRAIANACGTSLVSAAVSVTPGTVGATVPLADLVQQASPSMLAMLSDVLAQGELVGLAFARAGDQAALVLVHGLPRMQIEALTPPDAEGWVRVSGRLLFTNLERVRALVNQGAAEVARCEVAAVALPAFELRCPMASGDETALLEIWGDAPSQNMSRPAGTLMLRRSLEVAPTVVLAPLGEPLRVTDAESASPAMLERVNAMRGGLGLAPLSLSAAQSQLNARVAPSLLISTRTDPARAELLTRGLFAGRRVVVGDIRRGHILATVSEGTRDLSRWLSAALETPNGRSVLLAPDVQQLAVGALPVPEREALAVVVTTYSLFDDSQHGAEADALFERISAARVAAGMPSPSRLREVAAIEAQVADVCEGQTNAAHALQQARLALRDAGRSSVRVRLFQSGDLESGALPDAVLAPGPLQLGVVVAHTRVPGAAWGQYAVFLALR